MRQILIAKNLAYAANKSGTGTAADPSDLAVGALGVFTNLGQLVTDANLPDLKGFFIAVGGVVGLVKTEILQRMGTYDVRSAEYEAPVLQVATVTLTGIEFVSVNGTGTPTATYQQALRGDEAVVRIINRTSGAIRPDTQAYYVAVRSGDTATTLTAKLAAEINKDNDRIADATFAGTVLTLTAKAFGTNFAIAVDGVVAQGGSFTTTVPFGVGSGTPSSLAYLERLSQASTQLVHEQAGGRGALPVILNVDMSATYDLYFIDVLNRHQQKDGMDATYGRFVPITVAFPDGGAVAGGNVAEAAFQAVLKKLVNYTGSLIAPEVVNDDLSAA